MCLPFCLLRTCTRINGAHAYCVYGITLRELKTFHLTILLRLLVLQGPAVG